MSGSEDQGGAGRREVAYRLFAAEFEDADFSYSESDEERAPNYVISPTGGRVNRLFVVGVLTEVENASEDVLRARIVDPTGAFVVYAGQYQPEAQAFFERADPPMFVAITGKARTFQPEDSDVTYTSIRPENVNEVDAQTRDRWNVGTARQTLDRVRTMAHALRREERGDDLRSALEADGIDTGLAAGIPLAIDHYGTTPAYLDALRTTALEAAEVVAGEREEVTPHSASPGAPGDADLARLAAMDLAANVGGEASDLGSAVDTEAGLDADQQSSEATATVTTDSSDADPSTATSAGDTQTETTAESDQSADSDTAVAPTSAGGNGSSTPAASEVDDEPLQESPSETDPVQEADLDGAPDSDLDSAPETDLDSAPESDLDAAPDSDLDSAPESDLDSAPETDLDSAPESDLDSAPESDLDSAPESDLDSAPESDLDSAPDSDLDSGPDAAGSAEAETGEDLDEFDPGEFELDEDEREAIESEYGTEFQTGSEVGEPGEAGIETPAADELSEEMDVAEEDDDSLAESDEPTTETPSAADSDPAADSDDAGATDATPEEDVDVDIAVMDAMDEHDDGDGAHADVIVETVTARTGADAAAVRDAIQDALMEGRCYEPDDDVYKTI